MRYLLFILVGLFLSGCGVLSQDESKNIPIPSPEQDFIEKANQDITSDNLETSLDQLELNTPN